MSETRRRPRPLAPAPRTAPPPRPLVSAQALVSAVEASFRPPPSATISPLAATSKRQKRARSQKLEERDRKLRRNARDRERCQIKKAVMDEMRSRVEELEAKKRQLIELQGAHSLAEPVQRSDDEESEAPGLLRLRRDYIRVMRETELLRTENRALTDQLRDRDMFSGRMQHMLTEVLKEYEELDDAEVDRKPVHDPAIDRLRKEFSFSVCGDSDGSEDEHPFMTSSVKSSVNELLDQIDKTCDAWRAVFSTDVLAPVEGRLFTNVACLRTASVIQM
ncbi:hypothetical protein ATCC90586_003066 [Pythium insidiosum]|nr:hypothetical protein ATCC90586_003066 [Pythium insidiosum]